MGNATLNRFFSSHHLPPFAIAGASLVHLAYAHKDGSNNPLGVNGNIDKVPFHPYLHIKDPYTVTLFVIVFPVFVFPAPNLLNHPDNHVEANPLVTPPHTVPEWYSLPSYAISRSIPHKAGGIVAMAAALLVSFLLPFINTSEVRSAAFRPPYRKFYWLFVVDRLISGRLGGNPVESPFTQIGVIATIHHFVYLPISTPFLGYPDKLLISRISRQVEQEEDVLGATSAKGK